MALEMRGLRMRDKVSVGQKMRSQAGRLGPRHAQGLATQTPGPCPVQADGPEASPTVFVVDDDPAIRQSLLALLESDGLRVAAYATAEAFLEAYDQVRPGCLVLDLRMPGMSGMELQEKLSEEDVSVPVILITGHGDVPTAVRAVKMGALEFIEKPFVAQTLLDSIRRGIKLDAERRQQHAEQVALAALVGRLTHRELEVLRLTAEGYAAKQVAAMLNCSYKTVDKHKVNLMKKLEVHDRVELAHLAVKARLIEP